MPNKKEGPGPLRAIHTIATHELRSFFYSPIAWVLLALFVAITSLQLASMMSMVASFTFERGEGPPVTQWLLVHPSGGVFLSLRDQLLYFVPLLTMGLFVRERVSGSFMLPASSPVALIEIVLGKYLALVVYFLIFMAYLLFLSVIAAFFVPSLDWGYVIAGLTGLYLLALAYAAIGLFISAITSHQIVAAIVTAAVLFTLGMIGTFGQNIPIIANAAFWLSMAGRVDFMLLGLITSPDVLYFLIIIFVFLALTYLNLMSGRSAASGVVRIGRQAAVILIGLVMGYVTSSPMLSFHADMTREKTRTLTEESRSIVASLDGPLYMSAYINALDRRSNAYAPAFRRSFERRLFSQYTRAKPDLRFEYVFYYASTDSISSAARPGPGRSLEQIAEAWAFQKDLPFDSLLTPEEAAQIPGLAENGYRPVFLARWQDRAEPISTFEDRIHFPEEDTMSAALKRFTEPARQIAFPPRAADLRPPPAANPHYAKVFGSRASRGALVHRGFDISEIDPAAGIAESIDTLVLASPVHAYTPAALSNIVAYIRAGGDLIILADPLAGDALAPILDQIGVRLGEAPIRQKLPDAEEELVLARFASDTRGIFGAPGEDVSGAEFLMYDAVAVRITPAAARAGFDAFPVLGLEGNPVISTAVLLERDAGGEKQKIAVIGDADFFAQGLLTTDGFNPDNYAFGVQLMGWLQDGVYPGDYARISPIDRVLTATAEQISLLRLWLQWGLPILIVTIGTVFLLLRRRA